MIVKTLVSRPEGSIVAYVAIQYTQSDSYRLRTEVHQLDLTMPTFEIDPSSTLCAVHVTEGALVAFSGYVLAYALSDRAQSVLVVCWVTRESTRLLQPIPAWEVRWQHQSCRAVVIADDIVLVVRDSGAEIYPRAPWTNLDPARKPNIDPLTLVEGALIDRPATYATHISTFAASFVGYPHVYVHPVQKIEPVLVDGQLVTPAVRVISLIGLARSGPTADPSIPYFVAVAQPFLTSPNSPVPLEPPSGWLKYSFHMHGLQPQHPHLSYGQIVCGPNGRGIMLATNVAMGGGSRQYVLKFQHPSKADLEKIVEGATLASRRPPMPPHLQPFHQGGPLPGPVPHHPEPLPDPFVPLMPLMVRSLDILRGMAPVWITMDGFAYESVAWDEGGGTIMLTSKRGDAVILECALPPPRPPPPRAPHPA
ncbi:hypothetical protein BDV93DRAFT_528492 [Ceratobasidium sp. AG-I]|nr:hypothetical protein BDV93DRAFT_528492 [Ceratobasidium sp. AG-I]